MKAKQSKKHQHLGSKLHAGAWLLWDTVERLCRLELQTPSHWRVFIAVLATAARYGGSDAYLECDDIAALTGLAKRTVKAALRELIRRGLLMRAKRYGHLCPTLDGGHPEKGDTTKGMPIRRKTSPERLPTMSAPPSASAEKVHNGTFSPAQNKLIDDVLKEATALLGSDAGALEMSDQHLVGLGLTPPCTFTQARAAIHARGTRRQARDYTRAVLSLRRDERVQGLEL
jgi:hypothetical protein